MSYTKTYLYLFKVMRVAYLDAGSKDALYDLKAFPGETFETLNAYVADKGYPGSKPEDGIFYITVDTRNPRFKQSIETLQNCPWYINHYIAGDIDSHIAVIRFMHPIKKQWNKFLESKYSELYRTDDGQVFFLDDDELVMAQFTTIGEDGEHSFTKEWHVMMHTEQYFRDYIAPLAEGLNSTDFQRVKLQEYDEKIDLNKEIFDSNSFTKNNNNESSTDERIQTLQFND